MSVSLLWTLLVLDGLLSSAGSHSQLDIAARPGQNVTLPCRAPNRSPIRAAEWSRPDQGSKYVFFYRDDQQDKTHQHESFKDRVELADRQLKDGDLSLILIMARPSDTGRYECRVKQEMRRKRAVIRAEPVSIINLTVRETRRTASNTGNGQHVRGSAGLLLCLLVWPLMQLNIRG